MPSRAGSDATGRLIIASRRPPRPETSGLLALANASWPDPPVEPMLSEWTALEPLALMTYQHTDEVRSRHGAAPIEPARVARAARPTVPGPFESVADPRRRRPFHRIVLSFAAAAAAVAGLALVDLSAVTPAAESSARVAEAPVPAPAPVLTPAPAASIPVALATPTATVFYAAATVDTDAPRRPVLLPPAPGPGGRLEWRMPTRFSLGSDTLGATDETLLPELVATLRASCEPGTIVVVGHTCALGSEPSNIGIGKRRARNARQLLIGYGLPARHLRTVSAAGSRPEGDNATLEGRARNRRVTITCQPRPEEE